jgi:hypothetical protein
MFYWRPRGETKDAQVVVFLLRIPRRLNTSFMSENFTPDKIYESGFLR